MAMKYRWLVWALGLSAVLGQTGGVMAGPVTLRVGSQFFTPEHPNYQWWSSVFRRFEQESGIKVELAYVAWGREGMEKFITETVAGMSYDLVLMDSRWLAALQGKGLVRNLSPYVRRDNFNVNEFFEPMIRAVSTPEGLWALPDDVDYYIPYYNVDMFDEAGVPPPVDWTWSDYEAAMKKLTKIDPTGKNSVFGGSGLLWPIVTWSFGGDVIKDNRFGMNSPAVIDGLQWSYDLALKQHVFPRNSAEVGGIGSWHARFAARRTATHWAGAWYVTSSYLRDVQGLRWGIAVPPAGPAGRASQTFAGAWFIPSSSKNAEEAWTLAKFLFSKEIQTGRFSVGSGIPPQHTVARNPSIQVWKLFGRYADRLVQSVAFARAVPFHPLTDEVMSRVEEALDAAESGQKSVRQVVEQLEPVVNALLARGVAGAPSGQGR